MSQTTWSLGQLLSLSVCVYGDTHVSVSTELTSVGTCVWGDGVEGKDWKRGATVCSHTTLAPGYSVAVLHKAHGVSYVAGAPRHKLRGAVFELQKEDREDTFVGRIEGEQVPPGEVTIPPVGVLGCWGEGWAHPGQGSDLGVNSVVLMSVQWSPSVETQLFTPNPLGPQRSD